MIARKQMVVRWMVGCLALAQWGCGGNKSEAKDASSEGAKPARVAEVQETLEAFKAKHAGIAKQLADSAAYFVIPTVGEGGFIVGGGRGKGEAFEGGQYVGAVTVTELSIGAQVGGQTYSELVLFETLKDFERLKSDSLKFNAEVTAIVVEKEASQSTSFQNGMIVYVMPKQGLMAAAAVAGQRVKFTSAK